MTRPKSPARPPPTEAAPPARPPARRRLAFVVAVLSLAGTGGAGGYFLYRTPADPVTQAAARLDAGDPATARFLLLGVLRIRPTDSEAYWLLGRADLRLGDPVRAEHNLRQAGNFGIEAARLRRPLADALLAQRRSQEALDLLITDGAAPVDLPGILVARASGLEQLHDLQGAEVALKEAGRLAPNLIDVPLAAGRLALGQRDPARADREADHALLINGRSGAALLVKALAMEQRGQRPGALDLLTKAMAVDPKADQVRLERARMLLSAGRVAEARTAINALLTSEPTNVFAIYLKASVLIEEQKYADANSLLQTIQRFVPILPRGWYTVARVKLKLEQLEQAEEAVEKHLARTPDDVEGRKLKARIGLAAKRPGEALAALSEIAAAGTADAETFDLIGEAQAMAGRFAQELASFSRAAALAPNNPGILAHLGVARLLLGDGPGAVEALEHSLKLVPEQLEVSKQLVVAAVISGRPDWAAIFLADLRQHGGETASVGQLDALLSMAQLNPADASVHLTRIATRYPDDSAIKLQLARVLLMQGQVHDAEAALAGVLAKEPAQTPALNLLIPLLERSGRVPRAAVVLEAARAAAPGNLNLTLMLSGLYTRAGDPAKALAVFSGEAAQRDTSPAMLLPRAAAELAASQPAVARKTYEELLRSAPGRPDVVERFAAFLVAQGALDEASRQLASGLVASPGNPELQRALVRLRYQAAGLDAALATADALRREPANLPTAALLRGDVLLAAGRQADAADAYQVELTKTPSSVLAMSAAAAANAAHGPISAVQLLRSWVDRHPDDLSAMAMLASMLEAAKKPEAAAGVLEALLAQQPGHTKSMNNLAWIYYELGDARAYPLALRAFLSTWSPQVADTLGCILLAADKTQEALTLLRFAGRELPDNLPIRLHLAQAARKAGSLGEARTLLVGLAKQQFDGRATATQLLVDMDTP
jgi:putative PEP-CTERM system TPR-repeat lipoprotein